MLLQITYSPVDMVFCIHFNLAKYSWDSFDSVIELFKQIYLSYDGSQRCWVATDIKIREVIEWCEKYGITHEMTDDARKVYNDNPYYKRETTFYRGEKFNPACLKPDVKLFTYQASFIDWAVTRSRIYNADDPGLGKTLMTIAPVSHWYMTGRIDGVVLLVRSGLLYHWKREILTFSSQFTEDDIAIIENQNKNGVFELNRNKKILIIASHLWADVVVYYKKSKATKRKSNMQWSKSLIDINEAWGKKSLCLVIDEAHDFKKSKAVKSKALRAHIQYFPFRIFASATPAIIKFEDWYFQIAMLDRSIIPMSEEAFMVHIAQNIGSRFSMYDIRRYDHARVDKIRESFNLNVVKRLKKDIPEVATKQIIKPIYFGLPMLWRQLYREVFKEYLTRIVQTKDSVTLRNIEFKFPYAMQIIENPLLLKDKLANSAINKYLHMVHFENDPRYQYLAEYFDHCITELEEKVVVYDIHPLTLNILCEKFKKYDPLIIHGDINTTPEQRQDVQDLFNDRNSKHKVIFLSAQTSSAGLNLQKGSHRIVVYTQPNDTTLFEQLCHRTHRITSVEDTIVDVLVFDKTFDIVKLERNLNRKKFNEDFLTKRLSSEEIDQLLNGSIEQWMF